MVPRKHLVIILAVVACFLCSAGMAAGQGEPLDKPDAVIAIVTGSDNVPAGTLVTLDASKSTGVGYTWLVVPPPTDPNAFRTFESGRFLTFATPQQGVFTIVLSVGGGGELDPAPGVSTFVLVNGKPGPGPQPGPDPGPPPGGGWDKWAVVNVAKLVEDPDAAATKVEAGVLAKSLQGVCAAIAAGAIKTPPDARAAVKAASHVALGPRIVPRWIKFSTALGQACEKLAKSGKLETVVQYRQIWEEVATGLERVSNVK